MAELNLKQIIDRLNAEFTGETRKLVFWYDDKAEFAEDMETVELQNAKIYHLQPDNQFYTKYFLERVDKTTNYLIYAPFPKPDVRDNHLEDTMLYSRRFFADRASLLSVDLGIEEKYKPVIEKHIKFFANKERTQRFYDLEIENFNEENILVGLLSAVCKARTCSFEEVVRIVLTDGELVDNAFLQEFEKYDLLSAFWQLCEQHFGYTDTKPSLERLLVTLFVTYTGRYVQAELPAAWKSFVSYKSGNIIAFLDSLMNSVLYRDKYDALSAHVAKELKVLSAFAGMRVDDLVECDTFLAVDQVLVKWLIGRLVSEDIGAIVNGFTIPELCEKRAKMHFGRKTGKTYQMLSSAYSMVKEADYHAADGLKPIIDRYLAADYNMDQQYRKFYYYYDQLESTESFEPLRELVENIYTNEYLACLLPAWNAGIQQDAAFSAIPLQREFYNANLRYTKERTVVIISDAMRYEVGQELFARMQDDPKCTAKLSVQLSVLPSYTRLGMAVGSNVFKVAGGGANYVHGGSSPQEMLVPVLEFKMERGHMETKNAEIALVSIVHKITNLITSMDFIQSDAVSDTVKAAKYRIFFLSEDNEKISNENSYVADSREENAQKRIFRMRFTFKNKKYDKDKQYYLVVYDEESGLEQWRQPVIMDIAFADDFGFGF